ncbi:MAG: hypothetical protein V1652_01890 [bacterium]
MNKNPIFLTIVCCVIIFASCFILFKDTQAKRSPSPTVTEEMALYYREDCPHCKVVEAYIEEHHISEHVTIEHKEVMQDKVNAEELMAYARICGIDTNKIGIPFLWDGEACHMGDNDIITYLDVRMNPVNE